MKSYTPMFQRLKQFETSMKKLRLIFNCHQFALEQFFEEFIKFEALESLVIDCTGIDMETAIYGILDDPQAFWDN